MITSTLVSEAFVPLEIPDFRLHHILFYDDKATDLVDAIKKALPEDLKGIEVNIKKLHEFPYKQYNSLGVVEYKLGNIDTTVDFKPLGVFKTSQAILQILYELDNKRQDILVDRLNLHPYALTVASKIDNLSEILWTSDNLNKYKKSLGGWIEYYSGHWDDYSDDLYNERIESNLSNRLSELHFIRSNSAFIFMPRHDPRWPDWMQYMEENFVDQVLHTKSIMFVFMMLNEELDAASAKIQQLGDEDIVEIDQEMQNIENLQMLIADITSELQRERLMNRLHHSTKVIRRCFDVFSLDQAQSIIDSKIDNLQELVKSKHAAAQNKLQSQQKRWILILNGLVGYQVAFSLLDSVKDVPLVKNNYNYFTGIIWASMILLGIVSIVGLARYFLFRRKIKSNLSGKIIV